MVAEGIMKQEGRTTPKEGDDFHYRDKGEGRPRAESGAEHG